MNQSKFQIRRRGRGIQVVNTETDEVIHSGGAMVEADQALRKARKAERAERQAAKAEQGDKTAGNGAAIAKTFEGIANKSGGAAPAERRVYIGAGGSGSVREVARYFGVSGPLAVDAQSLAQSAIERLATDNGFVKITEELASDIRQAAFIVETVAHLRGLTIEYLPIAERLRAAIGSK